MQLKIKIKLTMAHSHPGVIQAEILKAIFTAGYRQRDGTLTCVHKDFTDNTDLYIYKPGRKDILFKKHQYWTPDWKIRKEILYRTFVV